MAVNTQQPLPRLTHPENLLLWADRLTSELWKRLYEQGTGINGATGAIAHNHVYHEELTGTGTSFALAGTPVSGSEELYYNLIRLRRKTASPGLNEYTISGTTITLGFSKGASDYLCADYEVGGGTDHIHVFQEGLSGTGTAFVLTNLPIVGSERLYLNLIRLRRVTSSPGLNEYTISGKSITLGVAKVSADELWADYLY